MSAEADDSKLRLNAALDIGGPNNGAALSVEPPPGLPGTLATNDESPAHGPLLWVSKLKIPKTRHLASCLAANTSFGGKSRPKVKTRLNFQSLRIIGGDHGRMGAKGSGRGGPLQRLPASRPSSFPSEAT